ncbi:N-acetylglucosaminyl-phosphatidylinositol de-N-acetylase [Cryptosporidium felis]|nr:N-acetylglucosaminyl-phosphatidylinositol de-N-acetylase [Cryptosporidium felis]
MDLLGTQGTICLVIAHPDDETLFFTPTLRRVCGVNSQLCVFCLTNGRLHAKPQYLGKGGWSTGVAEGGLWQKFSKRSGTESVNNVKILFNDQIQDQPSYRWPSTEVIREIETFVEENKVQAIITFDEFGISGHTNHISINESIRKWTEESGRENLPKIFVLETSNLLLKYSGAPSTVKFEDYCVQQRRELSNCHVGVKSGNSKALLIANKYLFVSFGVSQLHCWLNQNYQVASQKQQFYPSLLYIAFTLAFVQKGGLFKGLFDVPQNHIHMWVEGVESAFELSVPSAFNKYLLVQTQSDEVQRFWIRNLRVVANQGLKQCSSRELRDV